jgi:HAD-superfamily subfamily IB hydrolase
MNDFPLLDHVARHGGKTVATNPDDRLRSTAQERHWEILELFSEHKLF